MFLGGCPCCGKKGSVDCWKCYSNGTEYECVGPDDTPQAGWETVGKCYKTEEECSKECGPWQCYRKQNLPPMIGDEYRCFDAPPDEEGWEPTGLTHVDEESCNAACPPETPDPFSCYEQYGESVRWNPPKPEPCGIDLDTGDEWLRPQSI